MSNYHIDKYKWQYSLDLICPGLRSKDHELYICGSDGIDRWEHNVPMSIVQMEMLLGQLKEALKLVKKQEGKNGSDRTETQT